MVDLQQLKTEFENELYSAVLPFWEQHSMDTQYGGYYNCLDRNGRVYDTTKYMWLHSRQVWMFSKLYNTVAREERWKKIAEHGYDFLKKHAVDHQGRVFFSLNRQGEPVYMQRKIFSECFYAMATAEYARMTGSETLLNEARQMVGFIHSLSQDAKLIDRPSHSGDSQLGTLSVPMILLNVIEEVYGGDFHLVRDLVNECIENITMHFIGGKVYENVAPEGLLHDSSAGRLLNPGHAIEAGWFMKHWSRILKDSELGEISTKMIKNSVELGWDQEFGGVYYFLDSEGFSPVQLEWDMKLWWPHCEALYATLLIYSETGLTEDWERFNAIKEYTFSHFPDRKNGEWFGYLDRYGKLTHRFKGGPYKGCFHVPRSIYLCLRTIQNLENQSE